MCGIAGFSMHPSSNVNTRELTHHLLSAIEYRGNDASGFAFVKGKSEVGIYKAAVPGSQLPKTEMPRRATTGILHTRLATQGSKNFNENNHPVLSPSGSIALVHNGVISNDWMFRKEYTGGEFKDLAAVDSAVIPALIEKYGVKEAAAKLEGYAAVAFIDGGQSNANVLHIARLDYSPVAFTWLTDGSFIFASTKPLLAGALYQAGLDHGHIFEMPDETYMTVEGGVISNLAEGVEMQEDAYTRYKWSSHTSGNRATNQGSEATGIGSSFGNVELFDDSEDDTPSDGWPAGEWDKDYRNTGYNETRSFTDDPDEIAMALGPETNSPPEGYSAVWVRDSESSELVFSHYEVTSTGPKDDIQGFYITTWDGDLEYFKTIEEVEKHLDWLCNLGLHNDAPFPDTEHKLKWTNHVIDMGHIDIDNGLVSWLENLGHVDRFESRAVRNLEFMREGLRDVLTYVSI